METYQEDTYGERLAGGCDGWYAKDDETMIETLADRTGSDGSPGRDATKGQMGKPA